LRSSVQAGQVLVHLPLPVWPVVAALGAPVVEGDGNAFRARHVRQAIRRRAVLPGRVPGGQVDVAPAQLVQVPGVGQAGDVVDGVVEIEVVVVVAVHEAPDVVDAGKGQAAT